MMTVADKLGVLAEVAAGWRRMAEHGVPSPWGTEALCALRGCAEAVERVLAGDAPPAPSGTALADAVRGFLAREGVTFDAMSARTANDIAIRHRGASMESGPLLALARALIRFEMPR